MERVKGLWRQVTTCCGRRGTHDDGGGGAAGNVYGTSAAGANPSSDGAAVFRAKLHSALLYYVPVLTWGPTLTRETAVRDGVAGLIAGVMIVPTCLSWASLGGLPLTCGLSAALFASLSYGTFGQCAVLSIGPVAEITTLLISISGIPTTNPERAQTFQSLGVQVGLLSMVLSFIDGGKVIKMMFAKAVGDGYTCAAALLAISVQVKVMFNVPAPPATLLQSVVITTVKALIQHMTVESVYSFLLFMVYCLYLVYVKKIRRLPIWIPHQLIVVVVSTVVTAVFQLDQRWGLAIVGDVSSGLSLPGFPPLGNIVGLGPYTLTITMISFVQMYVIAQRVMPDLDPNKELFASGITNFICNVFHGMPVTNSFSCSSVLMEQRATTPFTAYAAGGVVLVTVVFLTRLRAFYYLPKQALAAIVVASVVRLVDFSGAVQLWRHSRKDAAVWILTFVLTVFGGITVGVLSGIMLSLVLVILRVARPRAVSVGFNMNTFRYGDLRKDPELLVYPNILMWRFDAPLFFVNTGYFQERLQRALDAEVRPIDVVLVTCGKIVDIDSAALASLPAIFDSVANYGIGDGDGGSDVSAGAAGGSSGGGFGAEEGQREDDQRGAGAPRKQQPRKIILTDIHGRLEKVLLATGTLPFYESAEYDHLSMEEVEASGKFPVVFKKLEDAIAFAQRFISERYGDVDTAPYPSVAFATDMVVATTRTELLALAGLNGVNLGSFADSSSNNNSDNNINLIDVAVIPMTSVGDGAAAIGPAGGATAMPTMSSTLMESLARLKKISTFTPDRELIGVMGVVRHTELTPKRKKKIVVDDPALLALAFPATDAVDWWEPSRTRRSLRDLGAFFALARQRLAAGTLVPDDSSGAGSGSSPETSTLNTTASDDDDDGGDGADPRALRSNWERVLAVVESPPAGLKVQLKPMRISSRSASFLLSPARAVAPLRPDGGAAATPPASSSAAADAVPAAAVLVVKWGGTLTRLGISQAQMLGEKLFARFFAAGDLPLQRLAAFTRHPAVVCSDENRVVTTALVVMNALTQASGARIGKRDIVCDDALMKTLCPAARRLLRSEYAYYSALLHIDTLAEARHYFHIPGYRQLLLVPPGGGAFASRGTVLHNDTLGADPDDIVSVSSESSERPAAAGAARRPARPYDSSDSDEPAGGNPHSTVAAAAAAATAAAATSEAASAAAGRSAAEQFHTPLQVLRELEQLLDRVSNLPLSPAVLQEALTNHETVGELRARYETLLENLRGAKKLDSAVLKRKRREARRELHREQREARRRERQATQQQQQVEGSSSTAAAAAVAANDAHPTNRTSADNAGDQSNDAALRITGGASSSDDDDDDVSVAGSEEAEAEEAEDERRQGQQAGRNKAKRATDAHTSKHSPAPEVASSASKRAATATAGPEHAESPSFQPHHAALYDVSDVSKLRDYASFDLSYNMPVLEGLYNQYRALATGGAGQAASAAAAAAAARRHGAADSYARRDAARAAESVQRLMSALLRVHAISECMARVGENVLEGINSSKRFIIGSLVGGRLLRRLQADYADLARLDEAKGVAEMLERAQRLHMADRGGVGQDVQHFMRLFKRISAGRQGATGGTTSRGTSAGTAAAAAATATALTAPAPTESPEEREFRLRFPFIALPDEDVAERAAAADASYTRFYFSSYLHVEGVLQCLFESVSVDGFTHPTKEELEAAQQLYMKHLIFKVFRRRNVGFTEAEALAALRRLPLLFRSDVPYPQLQRDLRAALARLYHSMYYVSMEVYLSVGDAESADTIGGWGRAAAAAEAAEGELHLLTLSPLTDAPGSPVLSPASFAADPASPGRGAARASFARRPTQRPAAAAAVTPSAGGGTPLHPPPPRDKGGRGRSQWRRSSGVSPSVVFEAASDAAATGDGSSRAASADGRVDTLRRTRRTQIPDSNVGVVQSSNNSYNNNSSIINSNNAAAAVVLAPLPTGEATVMRTPEAGRRAALVTAMRSRVSNVTPMKRIHEGISLADFERLVREAESAAESQQQQQQHQHQYPTVLAGSGPSQLRHH